MPTLIDRVLQFRIADSSNPTRNTEDESMVVLVVSYQMSSLGLLGGHH